MLAGLSALGPLTIHDDPEFIFRVGWLLCDVGEHDCIFSEHSPRRILWRRLSRPVGRSIRCGAIHASRRSCRKRKWADSRRWRLSAKPEESDSSAGDFEAAVKWIPGTVNIQNRAPRSSVGPL